MMHRLERALVAPKGERCQEAAHNRKHCQQRQPRQHHPTVGTERCSPRRLNSPVHRIDPAQASGSSAA